MRRRGIFLLVAMLLLSTSAYARISAKPERRLKATTIAVASTGSVYTNAFQLANTEEMSVMYKASSAAGSVDMNLYFEQSFKKPTTANTVDVAWVTSDSIDSSLTTEVWKIDSVTMQNMPWGRFHIAGEGSNNADAVIQIYTGEQED